MNKIKVWGAGVLAAAAVTACGGDVIAVLGALGAAGGDFTLDADPATARLETRLSDPNDEFSDPLGINIQVDDGANGGLGENLFDESFPVVVNRGSLGGASCAGVRGTITGDRLDLGSCFRGRYENVNRVVSDDGRTVLRFDSFNPNLTIGIWVDIQNTSRRVKFTSNDEGCELRGSTPTGNAVTVEQIDSDPSTGAIDSMRNFRIGSRVWAQGEYVGASGLRLTGGPGTLELERRRDDPATACP